LFSFPFREGKISFEAKIGNVSFNGRTEGNNSLVTFRSGSGQVRGEWNLVTNLVQSVLDVGRINYQTSDYKFSDAQLTIDNVFNSQKSVKIKSPRVSLLNNPLF
jgi:predicted HNH restriction endonuclease